MTLNRYLQLLDAYGADTSRWPEDERTAAQALAHEMPMALQAAQQAAAALDTLLTAHTVAPPAPALAARIVRQASGAGAPPPTPSRWRASLRWPAWAAVGLAGAATGALAATLVLHAGPPSGADPWSDLGDVFGGRRAEWSEE